MTRSVLPEALASILIGLSAVVWAIGPDRPRFTPPTVPDDAVVADERRAVGTDAPSPRGSLPTISGTPSDDPADWIVDTTIEYDAVIGDPVWIAPGDALPDGVVALASNNNVAIAFHDDRLFLAWRTASIHFASTDARIYVISSPDGGARWDLELEVALGADVREPAFIPIRGELVFQYFEAGSNPLGFEPKQMWRHRRTALGAWTPAEAWGTPGTVPWDVKVRGGRAFMTSYRGPHYHPGKNGIEVHWEVSDDGLRWAPVDPDRPVVYRGGVSEVAWELDVDGRLWAVTRNEDGDGSGWGSHVAVAPADDLAGWVFPETADPERFDSPEMLRHGDDLYLIARRDVGGPFDLGLRHLGFTEQQLLYLALYSARPKRTSLYRIDREARAPIHVADLPGTGDTAFPSAWRIGPNRWLVANYTSPLGSPDRWWAHGQVSPRGTAVYLTTITFVPR